jgi:hypothetical protein
MGLGTSNKPRYKLLITGLTPGPQEPTGGLEVMILRMAEYLSLFHDVILSSNITPNSAVIWEKRQNENFKRFYPKN